MEIRKAVVGDLKRIQELNLMLFKKEYEECDKTLSLDWTFGKAGTKYFEGAVVKDGFCVFVVEVDGEIVGYLVGKEMEKISSRNIPKMAELDNMLVLEEYQGKGVGRMLYGAFVEWCRGRGVKRVRVEASVGNKEGIEFYRRMGLEDYDLVLEGEV